MLLSQMEELIAQLRAYAEEWNDVSMLAKTHGQPASPTRLGKEVMVFVYRLERQLEMLKACPITAKFGGATGNYNAHMWPTPVTIGSRSAIILWLISWGWSVRNIRPRFPITTIWERFSMP